MAAPRKSTKSAQRPTESPKQRVQITASADSVKKFRIAAVSMGMSESDLFEKLMELNFPGLHVGNMSKSPFFGAGQGSSQDDQDTTTTAAPVVKIGGITNRIGDIARRSAAPVDSALDDFASE